MISKKRRTLKHKKRISNQKNLALILRKYEIYWKNEKKIKGTPDFRFEQAKKNKKCENVLFENCRNKPTPKCLFRYCQSCCFKNKCCI